MKSLPILAILIVGASAVFFYQTNAVGTATSNNSTAQDQSTRIVTDAELQPYQPLDLSEIYVTPAGPRGLELTEKARGLAEEKVQVKGYMVRYPHPDPKLFILSSAPMVLNFAEYRLVDELPPQAIHVVTNVPEGKAFNYYKHEMLLLGTIEYGPQSELDGRISHIRLRLDSAIDAETRSVLDLEASLAMQQERLFNAKLLE